MTSAAQHLRHSLIGGAVRTVKYDLHAVEPLRAGTHHVVDILVEKIVAVLHDPNRLARRTCRIIVGLQTVHELLEFILHRIWKFVTVAAKELDPIIRKRIV